MHQLNLLKKKFNFIVNHHRNKLKHLNRKLQNNLMKSIGITETIDRIVSKDIDKNNRKRLTNKEMRMMKDKYKRLNQKRDTKEAIYRSKISQVFD